MRLLLLLGAASLLAACGPGSTCDANTCAACCIDNVCHTELSDSTCSSGGTACVSCNTSVERCYPDTRTCAPFVIIGVDYPSNTGTCPGPTPCTICGAGGSCHAETHVFARDYPALAADPRAATCIKMLLQPATASSPAAYGWNSCADCAVDPLCCNTPWGAIHGCGFVLPGSW